MDTDQPRVIMVLSETRVVEVSRSYIHCTVSIIAESSRSQFAGLKPGSFAGLVLADWGANITAFTVPA
jgi:hypothetical protein